MICNGSQHANHPRTERQTHTTPGFPHTQLRSFTSPPHVERIVVIRRCKRSSRPHIHILVHTLGIATVLLSAPYLQWCKASGHNSLCSAMSQPDKTRISGCAPPFTPLCLPEGLAPSVTDRPGDLGGSEEKQETIALQIVGDSSPRTSLSAQHSAFIGTLIAKRQTQTQKTRRLVFLLYAQTEVTSRKKVYIHPMSNEQHPYQKVLDDMEQYAATKCSNPESPYYEHVESPGVFLNIRQVIEEVRRQTPTGIDAAESWEGMRQAEAMIRL